MNPVAEDIAKVAAGYAIGKKVNDIIKNTQMVGLLDLREKQLNELMNINGTLVSTNRIPIIVDNKVKGVVATFQDIKIIQENENRIRRTLHKKGLVAKYNFNDIKGQSDTLKNTIEIAKSYALSNSTILIRGETGTGKELFAQSIHNISERRDGPFVAINCAVLSKSLLESELFGYTAGAFTGASKGGKVGLFELAHRGTIFLDEIGEIPIEIQAQLLRVIQEKEIRRLGSEVTTPVDIRIITATNRNLREQIKNKNFREDLYYRISVLNLNLPPLREREGDIRLLSRFFFEKYLVRNASKYLDYYNMILDKVDTYKWYGNIRELENFIERISVLLQYHGKVDDIEKLINEFLIKMDNSNKVSLETENIITINETDNIDLNQWESDKIIKVLKENNLSIQKTAEELCISRTTLWRKMKQYNIECK
jgi:transcriptional regulator with PAS, ATPase and Fis domain